MAVKILQPFLFGFYSSSRSFEELSSVCCEELFCSGESVPFELLDDEAESESELSDEEADELALLSDERSYDEFPDEEAGCSDDTSVLCG